MHMSPWYPPRHPFLWTRICSRTHVRSLWIRPAPRHLRIPSPRPFVVTVSRFLAPSPTPHDRWCRFTISYVGLPYINIRIINEIRHGWNHLYSRLHNSHLWCPARSTCFLPLLPDRATPLTHPLLGDRVALDQTRMLGPLAFPQADPHLLYVVSTPEFVYIIIRTSFLFIIASSQHRAWREAKKFGRNDSKIYYTHWLYEHSLNNCRRQKDVQMHITKKQKSTQHEIEQLTLFQILSKKNFFK
jgi:hypothetical protein